MPNKTSNRLKRNIEEILVQWENRTKKEIMAAYHLEKLALRDSLPEFLSLLVNALSNTIDRTESRKSQDKVDSKSVGRQHGRDRALSLNYTIHQLNSGISHLTRGYL